MIPRRRLLLLLVFACSAASCGNGPPASNALGSSSGSSRGGIDTEDEIARAILSARTNIFDDPAAVEVVAIEVGKWEVSEAQVLDQSKGLPAHYSTQWTAKLRFKEPIAFIQSQVDDTFVVQIVAKKGDELEFKGKAGAMQLESKWSVNASAEMGSEGGPWTPMWQQAGDVTMGYKVFGDANRQVAFRTTTFLPVSRLGKWVEQGSKAQQDLFAAFDERMAKAQAAAQEQRLARQQAAEVERQRLAAVEAEKQQVAKAAETERQRVATEAATAKADAAQRQRRLAPLKPLQGGHAIVTADAGASMGAILADVKIDEATFTASGRGVWLREMPFREFTFECVVDERGAMNYTSTLGNDPQPFGLTGDKLVSRSGWTITTPSEADRAAGAAAAELGKRLQSAVPIEIAVETIDAAAAAKREPQFQLAPLTGTVLYLDRANPKVLPLFSANLAANKPYSLKSGEVVTLRLAQPVKANGLYIRNGNRTENLEVLVNGVHKATIATMPKLGGVILTLPPDLEILEIRLTAVGAAQVRTIGLLQ